MATRKRPTWRTLACTPCSIGARSRRESYPAMASICAGFGRWGMWARSLPRTACDVCLAHQLSVTCATRRPAIRRPRMRSPLRWTIRVVRLRLPIMATWLMRPSSGLVWRTGARSSRPRATRKSSCTSSRAHAKDLCPTAWRTPFGRCAEPIRWPSCPSL